MVSTFLKAGVPLNKLGLFWDLLEENGYRLAGRHPLSDIIPFILSEEKHRVKGEIADKDVSVIFDGMSRLGEAVVLVICFVSSDTWYVRIKELYTCSSLGRHYVEMSLLMSS